MSDSCREWQYFLTLFNAGKLKEALSYAKQMKDPQNKKSALSFLAPTKEELRAATERRRQRESSKAEKAIEAEIKKMIKDVGFLGK